ncbi:MAG: hypothetical protein ABI443_04125 [Chthoniobacterales bacterium]
MQGSNLCNPHSPSITYESKHTKRDSTSSEPPSDSAQLAEIVAAWPQLSPPLQAAILAIVRSVELKVVPPSQGFTGAGNEALVPTLLKANQKSLGGFRAKSKGNGVNPRK